MSKKLLLQSLRRELRLTSKLEQKATIEVSKAKGEAEAEKVAGTSKVEARMAVAKTEQEREVNEAAAKAEEAKLQAEMIVPAQKQKERVTIEAKAVLEAAKILKEAEAKADATKLQLEAEGTRKKLLAEGKRASLMAEADKVQAIEMAPALAVEKMIESGLTPQMVVQYKTVDQLAGIAQMFEHIHLGQVTVYGNENTAGNFMAKTAENLNPALDLLRSIPFADTVKEMFGKQKLLSLKK